MSDDSAIVNALIPGNRVEAIFGFCDLRNFTDTTEVLQDRVMVFVNQVAKIVHSIVDEWHGAANRNIGPAFLIVWRMRENFDGDMKTKIGDMSVISFVHIVAAINKSAVLKYYSEHPALLARLPNYRVRLGFGLHYGWAIEGAIGSDFKIDASYLSPHVNFAHKLESATRNYQVVLLISERLKLICSEQMARHFRCIDNVVFKGRKTPNRLHTLEMMYECLQTEERMKAVKSVSRFEIRLQREREKEEKLETTYVI